MSLWCCAVICRLVVWLCACLLVVICLAGFAVCLVGGFAWWLWFAGFGVWLVCLRAFDYLLCFGLYFCVVA